MERQETIKGNERKDVDYGREMIDMIFVEHVNRNFIGDYQIHNMEDALKMTGKEQTRLWLSNHTKIPQQGVFKWLLQYPESI